MIFKRTHKVGNKEFFVPQYSIFIPSIDKNGKVRLKKVLNFSVHYNTDVVRISHPKFGSFLATKDHSLLVYHKKTGEIFKASPNLLKTLKDIEDDLYLISYKHPISQITSIEELETDIEELELIPIHQVKIEDRNESKTTYDFTVDDFKTFAIDSGVFVQDTVAIYMPLTKEAQQEARRKLFRKTKSIATGSSLFELEQGMILGLYLLTRNEKPNIRTALNRPKTLEYDSLYKFLMEDPDHAYITVHYSSVKTNNKTIRTTLGRILVNLALPPHIPFIDQTLDKKSLKNLMHMLSQNLNESELLKVFDQLRFLGFKFVTRCGISMPLSVLKIPKELKMEAQKVRSMTPEKGIRYIQEVLLPKLKEYVKKHAPQTYILFDSGARGSWSDLLQMVLIKGYVEDAEGKVVKIPITKGFVDNLNAEEAFIIAPSARVGIINRSIRTAEGGYLTRKLVNACATTKIDFNLKDCKTDKYLEITLYDEDWAKAVIGRYLHDKTLITEDNYKQFIGKTVKLRSPIFCKSPKICLTCYGELYKLLSTEDIGIESAQIVGERGTQLIMKTFHTGGLAELKDIPRVVTQHPHLYQEGDKIFTKSPCKVIIPKDSEYKLYEDKVILETGIAIIEFSKDLSVYEIDLMDESYSLCFKNFLKIKVQEDEVILFYDADQEIAELELLSHGFGQTLTLANKLFERTLCRECDIKETLEKIFSLYKATGRKLIHFEIILSNMVRSKSNPYLPFRLSNDKDYIILGVSKVPFFTSPFLAFIFQNIGKAIETGLIAPNIQQTTMSDLEKLVLQGHLLEKDKKQK
jgi:hypothetical protein